MPLCRSIRAWWLSFRLALYCELIRTALPFPFSHRPPSLYPLVQLWWWNKYNNWGWNDPVSPISIDQRSLIDSSYISLLYDLDLHSSTDPTLPPSLPPSLVVGLEVWPEVRRLEQWLEQRLGQPGESCSPLFIASRAPASTMDLSVQTRRAPVS